MKQGNNIGKALLLLCALMMAAVSWLNVSAHTATETPKITSYATATGRCTNVDTEGIEYYYPLTVYAADSDRWRSELEVSSDKGEVLSLELEVLGSSEPYQCTELTPTSSEGSYPTFSCNTIPSQATITGAYLYFKPDGLTEDTAFTARITQLSTGKVLNDVSAVVTYPAYPCSRNSEERDLYAYSNEALIYNTSADCPDDHQVINFYESDEPFTFANMLGTTGELESDRFYFDVSPEVTYQYKMEFTFEDDNGNQYHVTYVYNPDVSDDTVEHTDDVNSCSKRYCVVAPEMEGLTAASMPLTLVGGRMYDFAAIKSDLWGNPDYPTSTDFTIKMYYGNEYGTIGYENSSFHFTRYLDIQFAPYCESNNDDNIASGVATADYDKCGSTRQIFTVNLQDASGEGVLVPDDQSHDCSSLPACTSSDYVYVEHDYEPSSYTPYYFATRKCADSSCSTWVTTTAYPYSITVSDGSSTARTYNVATTSGTVSQFNMKAWDSDSGNHPFAIKEVRLFVDEPGTYVIFGFVDRASAVGNDLTYYGTKFYLTVNDSESISNCSTLANNGYFEAYWNDCLDYRLTQLLTFTQIEGEEQAWIENRSSTGMHYTFNNARSYLPKKFELASLTCSWSSVSGASGSEGYCNIDDIYVPAYTRVTVTGGTAYLESIPEDKMDYTNAFARTDTMSIMDVNVHVHTKACDNVKKIPDTGISLRSPLKVRESVKEDTSFVFTGNSLQIPAIGLGMEYPIPIVHVYYEEGAAERGWDLSTLGNYVGELEGGSYLPYAGNSALTGHYYSQGVFKNLGNLNPGDEIIILGNDGIRYTYRVAQKFYAEEGDVYEMFQQIGERSLTLVTCDNYDFVTNEYSRRLLVRATIDHQEPYEMAAE